MYAVLNSCANYYEANLTVYHCINRVQEIRYFEPSDISDSQGSEYEDDCHPGHSLVEVKQPRYKPWRRLGEEEV
jgi:hypothetical protein